MKINEELNEAVARKLGWTDLAWSEPSGLRSELSGKRKSSPPFGETVPPYSTSIEAAWEIVDHLQMEFALDHLDGIPWRCTLNKDTEAEADTASLAICQAFLKLL